MLRATAMFHIALIFTFYLEVGWIPSQDILVPESEMAVEDVFYFDMNGYLEWHFLWLEAGMKAYSWPVGWESAMPDFWPARIDYRCALGFLIGPVRAGIRHLCSHSVDPYNRITDGVDGSYDEIFLRISNER